MVPLFLLTADVLMFNEKEFIMFNKNYNITVLLCLSLILLSFTSYKAKAEEDGSSIKLTLSGGPMGGGASMALAAFMKAFLAEYPKATLDLMPGNGTANPIRVSKGQVNIAHAQASLLAASQKGTEPYKETCPNLRSLFKINDDCRLLLFVRDDAPIASLESIAANKQAIRFSPATRGSTNDMFSRWTLDEYGIDYNKMKEWGGEVTYISFDAMVDAMKDNQLDMVGWNGPGCPAFLRQIMLNKDVRFLPVGEKEIENLKTRGLHASVIKAGEFEGLPKEDVPCVADVTEIICSADLPDDVAYKIVEIWTKYSKDIALANPGYGSYDPEISCKGTALPLHPGAEKYYREAGWLK